MCQTEGSLSVGVKNELSRRTKIRKWQSRFKHPWLRQTDPLMIPLSDWPFSTNFFDQGPIVNSLNKPIVIRGSDTLTDGPINPSTDRTFNPLPPQFSFTSVTLPYECAREARIQFTVYFLLRHTDLWLSETFCPFRMQRQKKNESKKEFEKSSL